MTLTESTVASAAPARRRSRLVVSLAALLVLALAAVTALAVALARSGGNEKTPTPTSTPTMRDVLTYVLDSGSPAKLAPFFAPTVDYAIAASGSFGTTSGAKVTRIVAGYVSNARGPWNFSPSAATVNGWKHGPYARYLRDDSFFGVSANDRFVSVRMNSAGEIDQVFLAVNTQFLE